MKQLSDEVVAEAFALSRARGAELLLRLGDFDIWRGDLAVMRDDSPTPENPAGELPDATKGRHVFIDSIVLARAIELLPPICRAALSSAYASEKDLSVLAGELDTDPALAELILINCRERLAGIYEALATESARGDVTIPEWVTEREHASAETAGGVDDPR